MTEYTYSLNMQTYRVEIQTLESKFRYHRRGEVLLINILVPMRERFVGIFSLLFCLDGVVLMPESLSLAAKAK